MPLTAGQSNLYFNRETKIYILQDANIWEVPVLNGYSAGSSTNSSDVTVAEMSDSAGNSRRARRTFTDSVAPSEWSFSTYARPYIAAARHRAVEEVLWANFVAPNSYTAATPAWAAGITFGANSMDIDFNSSNKILLGTYTIYVVLGAATVSGRNYLTDGDTVIYRIQGAVANEVSINFDLEGIATLQWSGMGGVMEEIPSFDASAAIVAGMSQSNNFIRNRLTQLALVSSVSGSSKTYNVTLTGGSITINNGISFLTPETLGVVNQPLGHVAGTRTVSGNFTAYLDEKTNGTIDLLEDISKATTQITNKFALDFYVGGKSGTDAPVAPGLQFKMPLAHLSIPSIDTGDIVAISVDFSAQPSNIGAADEISKISYVGI